MAQPSDRTAFRPAAVLLAIVVLSTGIRLALAVSIDIFQDEALYWWWAAKRVTTFCPQPPAVAWMVRCGSAVFGEGMVGLRAGSLLWGTGAIVAAYALAKELYGSRAGLWAAAFLASCPLFVGLGAMITPDALLVFLWLVLAWTTWRAVHHHSAWWLASGAVLAAGFYTKYMTALALPCAFLALCSTAEGRSRLRRPWPWAAALLALALFLPVFLAWNARNGWTTLRYHLSERHHWECSWGLVESYVLGHLGVISPLLCIGVWAGFVAAWRAWRRGDARGAWLLAFGLVPILFFAPPNLFTQRDVMRDHWDAIGYAVGAVGFAAWLFRGEPGPATRRRRRLGLAALATAWAIDAVFLLGAAWPGGALALGLRPPTYKMLGWRQIASQVRQAEETWRGTRPRFLLTDSFDHALCLAFHLKRTAGIYTLNSDMDATYGLVSEIAGWKMNELSMKQQERGHDALYIQQSLSSFGQVKREPEFLRRWFAQVEPLGQVDIAYRGRVLKVFSLYRCQELR